MAAPVAWREMPCSPKRGQRISRKRRSDAGLNRDRKPAAAARLIEARVQLGLQLRGNGRTKAQIEPQAPAAPGMRPVLCSIGTTSCRQTPHAGSRTSRIVRRYIITSASVLVVSTPARPLRERISETCVIPATACQLLSQGLEDSTALAQPGDGESAEQQQQADQPGEYRQYANAPDHARVAHLDSHPAVAMEHAGRPYGDDARQVDA